MNDFDYDVRQKKALARNAIYRKNGCKSKKCTLPSDKLSKAEWKKRNGEIMTYDFGKPISWKDWKAMPDDLQVEYFNGLKKRFPNIPQSTMASDLFHVAGNTLSIELSRLGISGVRGGHKPMPSVETRNAWKKWILWNGMEPKPIPAHTPEKEEEPMVPKPRLDNLSFVITGDNEQIESSMPEWLSLLPKGSCYSVSVRITRNGNG